MNFEAVSPRVDRSSAMAGDREGFRARRVRRENTQWKSVSSTSLDSPPDRLAIAVEAIVYMLLLFMPAALGAVQPWSETVVFAGSLVIAFLLAVRRWRGESNGAAGWTLLPIVLFIGLILLQLAHLPAGALRIIAPPTFAMKRELLSDLPNLAQLTHYMTLSFYPPATRHDLRIVLFATSLFAATIEVFRRPAQIVRLLAVIAAIGGAEAVLALIQNFTGTEKIYWIIPSAYRAVCGSFINYSNFCQFMNASIGAALGLLLVKAEELPREREGFNFGTSFAEMIESFSTLKLQGIASLAVMIMLGSIAVFLSMSRGGILSFMVGVSVMVLLLARRGRLRGYGWLMTVIGLAVFVTLLYGGFELVCDRLATIYKCPDPSSGRFQTYKDIAVVCRRFPIMGIGLGSHSLVYPMFDRSNNLNLAEYADSDWFQLFEETGILGITLVLAFVGLIGFHLARAIRADRPAICTAAFGLGAGLIAVVGHSFTDFGQHLPADAALSAIFCGLIVNFSRMPGAGQPKPALSESPLAGTGWLPRLARAVPFIALTAALAWALISAETMRVAAGHWDQASAMGEALGQKNWLGNDAEYTSLLQEATAAADLEPDNVNYEYGLNCMRWYAVSRAPDGSAPATDGQITFTPEALGFIQQIVGELHGARLLCPTFGPLSSFAGQLELFALGEPIGAQHVRQGFALNPTHPAVCFSAARVAASEGKWDESIQEFQCALSLDRELFPQILPIYIQAKRPDLAIKLAKNDPQHLLDAAYALDATGKRSEDAAVGKAFEETMVELRADSLQEDAPVWLLRGMVDLAVKQNDFSGAITFMKRAIVKDYGKPDWHLLLAQLLAQQGRTMDAVHEARITLRLNPAAEDARQLLGNLSTRRDFVSEN